MWRGIGIVDAFISYINGYGHLCTLIDKVDLSTLFIRVQIISRQNINFSDFYFYANVIAITLSDFTRTLY